MTEVYTKARTDQLLATKADKTSLAPVATTGAYADLGGLPTIPTTAASLGAVPTTRTVNAKPLSADITLTAADVSAVPTTRTVAGKALSANVTIAPSDLATGTISLAQMTAGSTFMVTKVGANWTYNGSTIVARPTSRTDLVMWSVSTDGTTPSFGIADLDIALTVPS